METSAFSPLTFTCADHFPEALVVAFGFGTAFRYVRCTQKAVIRRRRRDRGEGLRRNCTTILKRAAGPSRAGSFISDFSPRSGYLARDDRLCRRARLMEPADV